MNFQTSRGLSFILALITTILFLAFSFNLGEVGLSFLFRSLLLFIISFILYWFLLQKLLFNRIKEITESIKKYRDYSPSKTESEEPLNNLSDEIHNWASDRKREIEQLKKLEVYRKEFLGNVSHELKTPIFNIQGYISTLLEGGLQDDSINMDYLGRADKSVERMITIVEDLEAISQLEAGSLELYTETFNLAELTKDVLFSEEFRATGKGIILSLEYYSDTPVLVKADKFRIRQVLTNLIVNSIKYGREYGETKVQFIDSADRVIVEVVDNGIGISKEHLPRLFERFYRVDKGRSRDEGGTGLGLAIVKHIIEAHNQQISVVSTPGVGTTFSFSLKKADN